MRKNLPAMLMIASSAACLSIAGCQDPVEDEISDVAEAREDVQEEQSEAISEIEGEVQEGNEEIVDDQQDLLEEKQELNEAVSEQQPTPAATGANVEGDSDALEEVEPQN